MKLKTTTLYSLYQKNITYVLCIERFYIKDVVIVFVRTCGFDENRDKGKLYGSKQL